MIRYGNLYNKIYTLKNLLLAHKKARKGKRNKLEVIEFEKNLHSNILKIRKSLITDSFNTSKYHIFTIYDPKEREIYKLPYSDRVVHHAILNIIEPIFVSTFTSNVYNCIKFRGIHKAFYKLKYSLKDVENTKYCLKLDIQKFYPSISNNILKLLLQKKFKDKRLLKLLFNIIDSTQGQPIGNYTSQYLANFYLCYFDHYMKEILKVKYYYRYCDDLVILNKDKEKLHYYLAKIREYLNNNLELKIKDNYQVFPVESRGINFIGYIFYHEYIEIRPSIKNNFIKMIKYNKNDKSIASYNGWFCHADCINLTNKYLNENTKN